MSTGNPTMDQISKVTMTVTQMLRNNGLESCLSGGVGCASYGCTQVPNVIDIVVLTKEYDVDDIKAIIATEGEDFFIRSSEGDSDSAAHKTLYCKIGVGLACKVVICVLGSMGLTLIPGARMHQGLLNGQPVLALPPLLLLLSKLEAWDDHRNSPFPEEQWKQDADTQDINQLVEFAVEKGDHLKDCFWVPSNYIGLGKKRFRDFARHSLVSDINLWNCIGFSRFEFY